MKKIIISLCLVMILVFNAPVKCYADAGSLIVSGGSIAVGGLGAGALAGLSGPVVVAVFLGLMAFGFNVELTKQSEASGKTKTQFVKDKINEYCSEIGITAGVFNSYILEQMEVLQDGRIKLSDLACQKIKQFGNWLVQSDQVQAPAVSDTESSSVTISGHTFPVLRQGDTISVGSYRGNNVTFTYVDGDYPIALALREYNPDLIQVIFFTSNDAYVSSEDKSIQISYKTNESYRYLNLTNNYYYRMSSSGSIPYVDTMNPDIPFIGDGLPSDFINTLDGSFNVITVDDSQDTFTGDKDDWASGNNVLDPAQDKSTVINPELTQSIPIPADKDYTVNVNDYLDAIQKVLDKLQDVSIPAVDEDTAVPGELDIPNDTVIDPTIEKVDDTDLPDPQERTPVIDKNNPPDAESNPNLSMDPLKFDLKNIFPFCLPWDIKDMLSLLEADPVAPSYHVKWYVPFAEEYLEFTVDLSGFNDVAAILRNMELLLFCVGLAYVTRSMFIRS